MPFDFRAYDQKCAALTAEELQREWQHYTRLITGAATSTTVSGLALPLTLGVSSVGIAMAAPAIHNARKKREIIERHLQRHEARHVTRKRDVLGGAAISGTIGVITLGVGTMGADAVAQQGAEHGINAIVANETAIKVVTHAALDGVGMGVEHVHTDRVKKREARKAFEKAGVFQAVDDAKEKEAGYAYRAPGQQQNPYGLQAHMADASSSRLSVVSVPPPYSPGQQPTQYQPTAINVPAYYLEEYPQYATLDAKLDPCIPDQQRTLAEWASHQHAPTDYTVQTANAFDPRIIYEDVPARSEAENILAPPVPRKVMATPLPVTMSAAADPTTREPNAKDMDDLIANIDQQLSMTETRSSIQSISNAPLSCKAGPVVMYYELEGGEQLAQPQVYQHSRGSDATQTSTIQEAGKDQLSQGSQPTVVLPEQTAVFSQPDATRCPRPPGHTRSPSPQSINRGHMFSHEEQLFVPSGQLPMTPQSTASSYHCQGNQTDAYIAQHEKTHQTTPLLERYVPTPMTPPSNDSRPQAHHQKPSQPQVSYLSTPPTPPTPQSCQQQQQQQQSGQAQSYFPPPPPSAVTPPYQTSKPIMSKRKSIMAAVALKATQTLSHHRTPSAALYNQPQYLTSSPQPQGQPQQSQSVPQQPAVSPQQHQTYQQYYPQSQQNQPQLQPEQFQTHENWSHPQQQVYKSPYYRQSSVSIEEPVYAPVPVPQAYSTRPRSQVFPPTPMSPPNLPTVQYSNQQEPGYFPAPAGYNHSSLLANAPMSLADQGQGYYLQQ